MNEKKSKDSEGMISRLFSATLMVCIIAIIIAVTARIVMWILF